MASPNKNPEYQAKLPRYGHDMSFDYGFTASTGMLLPIVYDFLNPGEKIQGGVQLFTQLQFPLQVPAQVDMEQIVDYFFVPMPMIYQPFESVLYQTNDYLSSSLTQMSSQSSIPLARSNVENLPCIDFWDTQSGTIGSAMVTLRNGVYAYDWHASDVNLPSQPQFECLGRQSYRLLDMFGFNADAVVQEYQQNVDGQNVHWKPLTDFNPNVFPYQLAAYQCVYQYFYRIDMWERFRNTSFNLDRYFSNTAGNNFINMELFQLRYRPKYLDYFTNVKPSPYLQGMNMLFDSGSSDDNSAAILTDFKSYLQANQFTLVDYERSPTSLGARQSDVATQVYNGYDSSLSSQLLRNLKAADKFLQITARAANRYDDQVLAHLGYKVPHDVKHNIKYLGSQRAPFKISSVTSTDSENLGDRAGYALGSVNGKGFNFTAPCHGVFIGIYSVMVKPRYIAGIDRKNVFTDIHDVWQPEYDDLGMQPVYAYELRRTVYPHDTPSGVNNVSAISAWQWRYEQWKRNYSRVSSAFRKYIPYGTNADGQIIEQGVPSINVLSSFFNIQNPVDMPYVWAGYSYRDPVISNDYLQTPVEPTEDRPVFSYAPSEIGWYALLTPPNQLDNILPYRYDGAWHGLEFSKNPALIYQTDPFIVDAHINYKKVSPMSVHSMPSIGD